MKKTEVNPIQRFLRLRLETIPKVLRVLLLLAVVHGLIGAWVARSVYADVQEALFSVGSEVMRYAKANHQDMPRTLRINGQHVLLSVGNTDGSVKDVLDHFEGICKMRSGRFDEWLKDHKVPKGHIAGMRKSGLLEPVMREDSEEKGVVACLDVGDEALGIPELVTRLKEFSESGDLGKIGRMRYIYAMRGEKATTFVLMWNDGSLNVKSMFPKTGDAPGVDAEGIPRLKGFRRILSASEKDYPQSITVYSGPIRPNQNLDKDYRGILKKQGWRILSKGEQKKVCDEASGFVAEKENRMIAIVAGENGSDKGFVNVLGLH